MYLVKMKPWPVTLVYGAARAPGALMASVARDGGAVQGKMSTQAWFMLEEG